MRLAEHLNVDGIDPDLQAKDKTSALRALARLAALTDELDEEVVFGVLDERERLASTGVGSGVAIPHGRTMVDDFHIVMAISRQGVNFDSVDGEPAQILVAVLAPEQHPAGHLKMLARISRVLRDPVVRRRLLAATDSHEVLEIVREEDSRH